MWRFLRIIVSGLAIIVAAGICFLGIVALFQTFDMYHHHQVPLRYWTAAGVFALFMLAAGLSQIVFSVRVLLRGGRSSNQAMQLTPSRTESIFSHD